MAVKPLKWALKKITGHELGLIKSVYSLMPSSEIEQNLSRDIRKMLMKHLGEKSFYYLDGISSSTFGSYAVSLPEHSVLAVIGAEPLPGKIVLHIDTNLVFLLIDRLLGGTGDPMVETRPLTETEQGVLQYFIMQALSQVWRASGACADVNFRFEKFVFDPRRLYEITNEKSDVVCVNFKVGIGELGGFLKMFVPDNMLSEAIQKQECKSEKSDLAEISGRAAKFDYIRTIVWADAGRVNVDPSEIAQIEPGDVILLDETGLSLTEGVLSGEVDLRVGRGDEGSLKASVESVKRNLRCTLLGG